MGNVCGCGAEAKDTPEADGDSPTNGRVAAAVAHTSSKPVGGAGATSTRKPQPATPIEAALAIARKELDKNQHAKFEDTYLISKLIGHGAFAKVSICTHNVTKEKFAVKSVNKNLEDPQKQRDGKSMLQ